MHSSLGNRIITALVIEGLQLMDLVILKLAKLKTKPLFDETYDEQKITKTSTAA